MFFVWPGVAKSGYDTVSLIGDGEVEQERPDLHRDVHWKIRLRGPL